MSNRRRPNPRKERTEAELWEEACAAFPDPLENQVIALAEQEGVIWRRIPGYGLRFLYQSPVQLARFKLKMAAIGQTLDE
ncbi:MAG TPA: hypothetical protein VFA32_12715 [Dehalococcoidia bacterium]|nr:hypothetical protein [Dehalococcoidia bacterium]